MNTMGTTDRQQAVLDFIRDFRADKGVMPSLRQIQGHLKFASSQAAHEQLQALEKKGQFKEAGERRGP
jgi:SOS-response transcriptional repressor LexA